MTGLDPYGGDQHCDTTGARMQETTIRIRTATRNLAKHTNRALTIY